MRRLTWTPERQPAQVNTIWAIETYRELVRRLKKDNFAHTDAELQATMVHYFTDFRPQLNNSCESKRWAEDKSALSSLQTLPLSNAAGDSGGEV